MLISSTSSSSSSKGSSEQFLSKSNSEDAASDVPLVSCRVESQESLGPMRGCVSVVEVIVDVRLYGVNSLKTAFCGDGSNEDADDDAAEVVDSVIGSDEDMELDASDAFKKFSP